MQGINSLNTGQIAYNKAWNIIYCDFVIVKFLWNSIITIKESSKMAFPKLGTVTKNWERCPKWEPDSPVFHENFF